MAKFRSKLQEYLRDVGSNPISLEPALALMVGWLFSWTCWCAHRIVKLCSCLKALVSALRQQGAAQGRSFTCGLTLALDKQASWGCWTLHLPSPLMLALGIAMLGNHMPHLPAALTRLGAAST